MAARLPNSPNVIHPGPTNTVAGVYDYLRRLSANLVQVLGEIARNVNGHLAVDGTFAMTGPLMLSAYAKASLPAAATYKYGLIMVTNDATFGLVLCYSDGTNWRHVRDGNVVS